VCLAIEYANHVLYPPNARTADDYVYYVERDKTALRELWALVIQEIITDKENMGWYALYIIYNAHTVAICAINNFFNNSLFFS
jgi:hypothetical protein